jgi:L-fucose isomerase-like protein
VKKEKELPDPKVGIFIVSDRHLNALNSFSMDVAGRIVDKLRSNSIDVYFNDKVLKGQREATGEAVKMLGRDLDAYIIYFPTWFESPTAVSIVRELEGLPFILWGFNMWENDRGEKNTTGSVVGELVLKGTLERMGYEFSFIYGFPEEKDKVEKALDYIYAARAKKLLRRVRFGQLGYTGIGMYPGTFDHMFMRRYIGPEIVPIPECEFDDCMNSIEEKEIKDLLQHVNDNFDLGLVNNVENLKLSLKVYLGLRKIIESYELDGINPRCHYDFSKRLRCTCCVAISMLSDEKFVTGCEGDIITSISMFIFYLLSDGVVTYGDILDFDERKNTVMFSACGFAPFSLVKNRKPVLTELEYDEWGFAGILSSNVLKEGRITFGRMYEKKGSYGFVYGTGEGIGTDLRGKRFPALNVVPDGRTEDLIKKAPTQHFALVYGDLKNRLELFLRMMNIEKVPVD